MIITNNLHGTVVAYFTLILHRERKMKVLLFTIFFVTSLNFGQSGSWEYFGNMPKPVAGGAISVWQETGDFYILGGYSDSLQTNVNWNQKFNPNFSSWELDSLQIQRFGLVAERDDNSIYIFGGITDYDTLISSVETWSFSDYSNTISDFNNNFNRIFSTGHVIGDNYYIIGGNSLPGTGSDSLPYIVEYNLPQSNVTFQIDTLFISEDLPEQQMSAVIGNDIYIFGGVINGISQDIYKFNVVTHTYEELPIKLIEPRAGGKAVIGIEPDKIYIIGGYDEDVQPLNSVEIFAVFGDDQYFIEKAPPIQEARYHFMTGYLDECFYIFGGFDENKQVIETIEKFGLSAVTSHEEESLVINNTFELHQNYPNPFNPTTTIKYSIPNKAMYGTVQLKIYDILGNEMETLINKQQGAGVYKVEFYAGKYPSGIYYYQLKTNSFIKTKKMILLK